MSTPAGWYDDGSGRQRWWDGAQWTENYSSPSPAQYPQQQVQLSGPPPRSTNGLAITSFVLSLVGVSVVAVILGHISLAQIKRTGQSGRGLGLAGTIIGYVSLGLSILVLPAIAIPVYLSTIDNAHNATAQTTVTDAKTAVAAYYVNQGSFPATLADAGFPAPSSPSLLVTYASTGSDICITAQWESGPVYWTTANRPTTADGGAALGRCPVVP